MYVLEALTQSTLYIAILFSILVVAIEINERQIAYTGSSSIASRSIKNTITKVF